MKPTAKQKLARNALVPLTVAASGLWVSPAHAHVSTDAFVLLLPTGIYIGAGVAVVIATLALLAALPARIIVALFAAERTAGVPPPRFEHATSLLSLALLALILIIAYAGPHDPLENILPLAIWTLFWVGLVSLQAIFGDLWRYLNPWAGLYRLLRGSLETPGPFSLPAGLGAAPGLVAFLLFAAFYLADPAPDDPTRLAVVVACYWLFTFAGMLLFGGRDWLSRGECFTMLLGFYGHLSPIAGGALRLPGWRLAHMPALSLSAGMLPLMLLATGSFDGLNETFWWLAQIGVNPLEFPGRSAIIAPTVGGLVLANLFLIAAFAATVYLGLRIVGESGRMKEAFVRLACALLPIAFAYHLAHYFIMLLINAQYVAVALNDPLDIGADLLGLGSFHVTTGFLNTRDTVRILWLSQAGMIVFGHVIGVLLSHAIALDMFKEENKAYFSQLPLAAFMVFYTLFGLWLLASPRGA